MHHSRKTLQNGSVVDQNASTCPGTWQRNPRSRASRKPYYCNALGDRWLAAMALTTSCSDAGDLPAFASGHFCRVDVRSCAPCKLRDGRLSPASYSISKQFGPRQASRLASPSSSSKTGAAAPRRHQTLNNQAWQALRMQRWRENQYEASKGSADADATAGVGLTCGSERRTAACKQLGLKGS